MDRLVYTALSGLRSTMSAQDVLAHNVANATTLGFKRDISASQSRVLQGGESFQSRIQAAEGVPAPDQETGVINQTGSPLAVELRGGGTRAVEGPEGPGAAVGK